MAKVFISHASEDKLVADAVRRELANRLSLSGEVFMSSDPAQMVAGANWFTRIEAEIRSSDVVLLMLSRRGARRPWVNFEASAAWHAGKCLIPVCYGKMNADGLPKPYSNFHALTLPAQKNFLIESVARHLRLPKPTSSLFVDIDWPRQRREGGLDPVETLTELLSVEYNLREFKDE